jgi:tetratricopeptide (TPR) repeat protein
LSSTSKATTTWWSIERYAADGGVELLLGCGRMLLWLLSRMATTAYWLPLPLYQRQEWELYIGAVCLVLLLGLIWKRIYPLDAWALWILMGLVPFALLTEGTIGALLAGPSRYLYLATGGWAVMLGWSLVELGQWISRRLETRNSYVLAGLLAPLLVSSYISLKKIEALSFYMSGRNYIADEETDKGVAQMRRALNHAPEVLALEDVYPRLCLSLINKPGEFEQVAKEGLKHLPESARLNLYMHALKSMAADSSSQKQALDYLAKGKRYAATENTVNVPMTLATAFNNLGHGFHAAQDLERTVIAYRYSLHYLPNRFNTLVNFAYALFALNKVQEAKEITQRAAQINSQEPRVMYLTALILQAGGKTAEALALAQEAMRLKPLAELFYLASFSYHRLGQYDQAAAMLEEGIRRKGETPNLATYKRLADYYHKSGQRGAAINAYGAALELAPDDAAARTNLAWLLYLDGQVKEAITHTLRALQKKPTSRTVFNLGLFYLSNEEIDKARATYALAIEQFGAAAGQEIGAAHNLKNLADQGIQAEAAREILKTYWRQ